MRYPWEGVLNSAHGAGLMLLPLVEAPKPCINACCALGWGGCPIAAESQLIGSLIVRGCADCLLP